MRDRRVLDTGFTELTELGMTEFIRTPIAKSIECSIEIRTEMWYNMFILIDKRSESWHRQHSVSEWMIR